MLPQGSEQQITFQRKTDKINLNIILIFMKGS